MALDSQFQNYIFYMRNNDLFLEFQGISELVEKLVKTEKYDLSISLFTCEVSFDPSYRYYNSRMNYTIEWEISG